MAEIVLRPMKLEDQEMVMKWRTLPQITRYMNTNSITDIEKQKEWFKRQEQLDSSYQWIIEWNGKPVGVTSITEVDMGKGTCTRGTYVAEQADRSFGMITDIYANQHDFIFEKLNLKKIEIEVFQENKMCGFHEVEILENHVEKNGKKYNIVRLELTREEWEKKKATWNYNKVKIITKEK